MATRSLKLILNKFLGNFFKIDSAKTDSGIRCFEEDQIYEKAFDTLDRGTCFVPLDNIVGSVGRYQDFDERFRLKQHISSERLDRIKEALRASKPLPPVNLYQIKNEYYVLDGNHRVSAAKELGFETIKARIVEFIPSRSTFENILYREKFNFYDKSGLSDEILLSEVGQYGHLLEQIHWHLKFLEKAAGGIPIPFNIAAKDWYDTIYLPMVSLIKRANLLDAFPNRTMGDLYCYISFHQWHPSGHSTNFSVDVDHLIPDTMEGFRNISLDRKDFEYPEMHRVITAFVLMKVNPKKEYRIVDKLFSLDAVREVHSVHGETDILVKIILKRDLLCSDAEIIGQFVHDKTRQIPGVISTTTLIPSYSKIKDGV